MATEDRQGNRDVPLLPPYWFVQRFMEAEFARRSPGDPLPRYRTALDPLVQMAWYQASRPLPFPLIMTGV